MVHLDDATSNSPHHVQQRLAPAIEGLRLVMGGEPITPSTGTVGEPRRFLGWTVDRHWVLHRPSSASR